MRIPALLLSAVLVLAAGCGGGGDAAAKPNIDTKGAPFAFPSVSDHQPGAEPTMVSNTLPPEATQIQVLHEGTGRKVGKDDVVVTDVKGQVWDKGGVALPAFVNSFKTGQLLIRPLSTVVPAWEKALPGVKVGSRVLLVAPAADGFGDQGNPGVGILPGDSLMFVIDVLDSVAPGTAAGGKVLSPASDPKLPTVTAGKAPKVNVPRGVDPPAGLVEQLLQQGAGAKVQAGQTILAEYVGVLWRNGKVFDSSWDAGRHPFAARIATTDPKTGESGVIKGWVQALTGKKVGSRLLLVVPPELGYGKGGNSDAGITGTDTLVFVIDILGVYGKAVS
ncbi:MAG TPA: FKBP-type peptidyl-prolyl cis-trans isomerase [Sporichthya sp.]|nr:FKBP-type peptidyl-prolyl cis-trans isomerase [Sporichthya sp.]